MQGKPWSVPKCFLVAVLAACLSFPAFAADAPTPPATLTPDAAKIDFLWGQKIPLRDGVQLNATVYLPKDAKGPAPCVFTLTPYIAQTYHDRGVYFAAHGYPFLVVDVRGRGNSEGMFRPMIQEAHDGYDVVEWLARQPYCNGKVTMWGGSYAGYDQWATAAELPPHLATIVPVASPYPGVDFPISHNIADVYAMQWLTLVSGRAAQDAIFDDDKFWTAKNTEWFKSGTSFRALDRIVGNPSPIFQEWLDHPMLDAYWDAYNPSPEQYAQLKLPILTITGEYDGDQPGAMAHYNLDMQYATAEARDRHYLVIGPWSHDGTRTPTDHVAGIKLGPAALLDLPKLHLDWYAWTMQGGPRPEFLKKRVAYYVIGKDTWRYADTLAGATAEERPFYLDSVAGRANEVFASGSLGARPGSGEPDHYVYDPNDVSSAELDAVPYESGMGPGASQLVYHSDVFAEDTEITGSFRLSTWLAIDQPDTDFHVVVYDIAPDGSSNVLHSDSVRARYRESLRKETLVTDRGPLLYEFNGFKFMSRIVARGHRLRVVIEPINDFSSQKNHNSGGVVNDETAKDARAVTVTLYHDAAHPSVLYVPIGQPEAKAKQTGSASK